MEFAAGIDSHDNLDVGDCYNCKKKAWIYVLEKKKSKIVKKHICEFHYIELIKLYLKGELPDTLDLFPKEMDILNLPIQRIIISTGTTLIGGALLDNYLMQINQKLDGIDKEIQNNASSDEFFLKILIKERTESELMKYLILAYKKSHNL